MGHSVKLVILAALAALIAGCTSSGPASTHENGTDVQPSKQGTTKAQSGNLQPPPDAPNPDKIMGSRG